MNLPHFPYGKTEMNYLIEKDPLLGEAIKKYGYVPRETMPDLFPALIYQIISQQVSIKGALTVWSRLQNLLPEMTPENIDEMETAKIQQCGTSMRKVSYMKSLSYHILEGRLDLDALFFLPEDMICQKLTQVKGIGIWTAEMFMIFSMQKPDILSFNDLGIRRGLCRLYQHDSLTEDLFEKYKKRYSPYATIASFYLWLISEE